MPKPTLIALDTETGGLSEALNPLLSIAVAVADETYNLMDGFEIKIAPPKNAVIELPAAGSFGKHNFKKRLLGYMNVWTKERMPSVPEGTPIITGGAAEVNGYIGPDDLNWDMSAIDRWNASASDVTQAQEDLLTYLTSCFGESQVVTVAHNAVFDIKFVGMNMPKLLRKLKDPWFCTLNASRELFKLRGVKQSAKLTEMAKLAGFDFEGKAHQAFADGEATLAVLRYLKANSV